MGSGSSWLKRAIQRYIEDELALKILSGDVEDGTDVTVDVESGKVVFK